MTQKAAMLEAGYSPSYADTKSTQFFSREVIQEEINRRRQDALRKSKVNEDWIVQRLVAIAEASPGNLIAFDADGLPIIDYSKLTPELKQAIGGLDIKHGTEGRGKYARPKTEIKIRTESQLRALELLMKYKGMLTEKVEISGDEDIVERLRRGRQRAAVSGSSEPQSSGTEVGTSYEETTE
jgi:hypothetical protein